MFCLFLYLFWMFVSDQVIASLKVNMNNYIDKYFINHYYYKKYSCLLLVVWFYAKMCKSLHLQCIQRCNSNVLILLRISLYLIIHWNISIFLFQLKDILWSNYIRLCSQFFNIKQHYSTIQSLIIKHNINLSIILL